MKKNDEIHVNGSNVNVITIQIQFGPRNVYLDDFNNNIVSAIQKSIEEIASEYENITEGIREVASNDYVFSMSENNVGTNTIWFDEASFWPYTDDSTNNLLHSIPYAYSSRNTEECLSLLMENSLNNTHLNEPYPYTFAFRNPKENTVTVMGKTKGSTEKHHEIINQLFQPELIFIIEMNTTKYRITITPKAIENPYKDSNHNLELIPEEHIISVEKLDQKEWVMCDASIQGSIKRVLEENLSH